MTLLSNAGGISAIRRDQLFDVKLQNIFIWGCVITVCMSVSIDKTALRYLWWLESVVRLHGQLWIAFFSCKCWLMRKDNGLDLLLLDELIRCKIFLHTHLVERSLFNWLEWLKSCSWLQIFICYLRNLENFWVNCWFVFIGYSIRRWVIRMFIACIILDTFKVEGEWVIVFVLPELCLVISYLYSFFIVP